MLTEDLIPLLAFTAIVSILRSIYEALTEDDEAPTAPEPAPTRRQTTPQAMTGGTR